VNLSEERIIARPPAEVWDALLNVDVLKGCIPGCQELSGSVQEGYKATVVQRVGPMKATFNGNMTLSDLNEPKSLKLTGNGEGGVAGFAKLVADVTLSPEGADSTKLSYAVDAQVGGKLAQLGSRIIDSFAKKMANDFFTSFQESVEQSGGDVQSATPADSAPSGEKSTGFMAWLKKLFGR